MSRFSSFLLGASLTFLLGGFLASSAHAVTFTVTSTADSGPGTLRQAVLDANAKPDADTISFTAAVTSKIALTSGEIAISGNVELDGPGADKLTVSGEGKSRIFNIAATGSATIQNLTLSGGVATGADARGGAILNAGQLWLKTVTLSGNSATGTPGAPYPAADRTGGSASGGALYNSGALALDHTTWQNNIAKGGNGGNGYHGRGGLGTPGISVPGGAGGAARGGALFNAGGLKNLSSAFQNNQAVGGAPGLYGTTSGTAEEPDLFDNTPAAFNSTLTGYVGIPYSGHLTALREDITYQLVSGSLPAGLTLDPATGIISGIPEHLGSQTLTFKVSNSTQQSNVATVVIDIKPIPDSATLVVTTPEDAVNSDDGLLSLREAIEFANANPDLSTISFQLPGAAPYAVNVNPTQGQGGVSLPVITTPINIQGPGAEKLAIRSGSAQDILQVGTNGSLAIASVTFKESGNVDNSAGVLSVSNCAFTDGLEGGLLCAGTTTVTASRFIGNAQNGIFCNGASAAVNITDSIISGNKQGGLSNSGTMTVAHCTVAGNGALYLNGGGGISSYGSLDISNSAITGNVNSGSGGGIKTGGKAHITNCTIAGNTGVSGGGIYNIGTTEIESCTLVSNSAENGWGVYGYDGSSTALRNSIVAGNTGKKGIEGYDVETATYGAKFSFDGHNLLGTVDRHAASNLSGDHKGIKLPDLKLGPLADNGGPTQTMALLPGSPAIDAGDTPLDTDQRGLPRNVGGVNDIGAFEQQQTLRPVITSLALTPIAPRTDDPLIAQATAQAPNSNPVTFVYQWSRSRSGKITQLAATGGTLITTGDTVMVGDVITVTVVATSGGYGSAPKSASVTIQNSPISIASLTVVPRAPYTYDEVIAMVKTADVDNTRPFYSYVWTKNGVVVRNVTNSRSGQDLYDLTLQGRGDKGDVIQVSVTVSDGASSASAKASATVQNSVPVLAQLTLSPQAPTPAQVIVSTYAGRDGDGDALTRIYKWKIGNKVLNDEHTSRLDLSKYPQVKAGDVITLGMRLSDGDSLSNALETSVTVVAADPAKTSNLQGAQTTPSASAS